MLQASISQLKSISTETQSKDTPSNPHHCQSPSQPNPQQPSPKTKTKAATQFEHSSQSPPSRQTSSAYKLMHTHCCSTLPRFAAFCMKFRGSLVLHRTIDATRGRHSYNIHGGTYYEVSAQANRYQVQFIPDYV